MGDQVNETISPGKCKDTAARVNTVLTARHNVLSADDLCHLVMVSKGFLNPSQLEKLWRVCAKRVKEQYSLVLPRRLVIPLPPLCDQAKQAMYHMVLGLVGRLGLPLHVRRLLKAVTTCTPAAVVKVGDIFRGGPKPKSPDWVKGALRSKKNLYREWAGPVRAGKGRAGHVCDHLVIAMKNKGYKPGPASSFFRALCASQVGLGIRPDIGGSFGGGFSAENFRAPWDLCASQVGLGIGPDIRGSFGGGFSAENIRAPWDQPKKIPTALWHPSWHQKVSEKNKSGGKSVC